MKKIIITTLFGLLAFTATAQAAEVCCQALAACCDGGPCCDE